MIATVAVWISILAQADGTSASFGEVLEGWRSADVEARFKADEVALDRWRSWTKKDLLAMEAASRSKDRDVAVHAGEALARIRVRRALGANLVESVPRIDRSLLKGPSKVRTEILEQVTKLRGEGTLKDEDLTALIGLLGERGWELDGQRAAAVALDLRYPALRPLLDVLLGHPLESVRAGALEKLAAPRHRDLAPRVTPLLKDPKFGVRLKAIKAIREMKAEEHYPGIARLLKDRTQGVRIAALTALIDSAPDRFVNELSACAEDTAWEVRYSFASEVAELEGSPHLPAVTKLLTDSARPVRKAALHAVSRAGARQYAPLLVPLLRDDAEDIVTEAAANLGSFGWIEAEEELARLLGAAPHTRFWAAIALGNMGARKHFNRVLALSRSDDSHVRHGATWALDVYGLEEAREALLERVSDDDIQTRGAAIRGLARLAGPNEADGLVKLLGDKKANVGPLVHALGRIGGPRHAPALLALVDAQPDYLAEALSVLGRLASRPAAGEDLRKRVLQRVKSEVKVQPIARAAAYRWLGEKDAAEALERKWTSLKGFGFDHVLDWLESVYSDRDPATYKSFMKRVEVLAPFRTFEEAEPWLKRAGLSLEAGGTVMQGRIAEGVKLSPRDFLSDQLWNPGRFGFSLEEGRLVILPLDEALKRARGR